MNIYIVASNTNTTYIVKAATPEKAIKQAKIHYYYKYHERRHDFEAYEINDYMKDCNMIDFD